MSEKTMWKIFWAIFGLGAILMFSSFLILVPVLITLLIIGKGV